MNRKEVISQFSKSLEEKYGKTFCLAKWKHLTLYLHLAEGHSCYHPPPGKLSVEDVKKNPWALHNTASKIQARQQMLSGEQPAECSYCWNFENLNQNHISDRHIKTYEESYGTFERAEKIHKEGLSDKVSPSYIEVSFSNTCNFKCIYCSPKASSSWVNEIKKFGPYEDLFNNYEIKDEIIPEEENPFLDSFKQLLPAIKNELVGLRITGGEPLLQKTTYEIIDSFVHEERPKLDFMINSNLGMKPAIVEKFCQAINRLEAGKSVKSFMLFTSLESVEKRAEYVRYGLDYKLWLQNMVYVLEKTKADISVMCTYNVLSVTDYTNFLNLLLDLRRTYCKNKKRIKFDVPCLEYPRMFHFGLLGKKYIHYIEESLAFMKANSSEVNPALFDSLEIAKLERIHKLWKSGPLNDWELETFRKQFFTFQKQADNRRGLNFREVFPELKNFSEGSPES
jgi:sulfatase maturation enzyme AslB (radical SAM superfamily)